MDIAEVFETTRLLKWSEVRELRWTVKLEGVRVIYVRSSC